MAGLAATTACAHQPPAARPTVRAAAIADEASGLPRGLGELRLDGAWSLTATAADFGGISGARLAGARLLLLSDRSRLFVLDWSGERSASSFSAALLDERPLADRRGRRLDAEALALGPAGERFVADEGGNRVVAFAGRLAPASVIALDALGIPPGSNEGVEAIEVLPGGALAALAEAGDDGANPGVLVSARSRRAFRYRPASGFQPTDMAAAPPWLFVLERRLSLIGGWQARIVALPITAVSAGAAPLVGRELALLRGSELTDNFEAVVAVPVPGGIRLLILSDDNFSGFQRTLLLSLLWPADQAAAVTTASGG